ncbi:Asp23/Gls24 family envelope stress response protein [Staphylococcus haemolyticus]|uniref:Asp23/Gls24 family envelope stress response protein n=1 Tax=Staphylococcus haemolyticus TaxID=1283 RepID=UPI00069F3288|nr:Asp23/Gls24 family envelope stress response protein [Staphylococcus haemolyticus]MBU6948002.1 Asp23/Gls24 family envelope stress response protein [Staphylococcus haemolyticus]MBU7212156.1 Asp23/Gls24 family envelope stress response protein [Staphylococcus haemolyticus]MCE5022248.1 Asp23/Gls24 family envelope stress response protein [Staphylococcus haemolyticus]MEB5761066.1 Asp23/Gls24 family envelope stress response protein [Staphylococcus haemolyticus]PTK49461.1 Asp23/Gls24 family envelope
MVKVADYSNSNLGKIEIAPEVISVVASIAVSEVEGVTGHFSELKNSNIEKISRKNLNRNLKIDVKEDGIQIDVFCSIKHGINISKFASKTQTSIFNSIKTMTAIEPKEINVHIMHITVE